MHDAARDIDEGGPVARLFEGVAVPPGSVPALRFVAALHHLVLSGRTPQLEAFYPSVGGDRRPQEAWPVVLDALEEHFDWVHERLGRTVQTNDPGRAVVVYAALLWLTERHGLPVRLLEIGASAGLNLLVDRYCYVVDGTILGDPSSPVRFSEPWERAPEIDLPGAAQRLKIQARAGCDLAPLDAADPEDRLTLLSYIWPDEPDRLDRTRAAFSVAADLPHLVVAEPAGTWLRRTLASEPGDVATLTVVWHSLFRQYVDPREWEALETAYAGQASAHGPIVWLAMEPGRDHLAGVELTIREAPSAEPRRLARCGDHGAPVLWG